MADVAVDQAPSRVNYGAAHVDRLQTSRVGAAGDPKREHPKKSDDQTIPVARDQLDGKRRSGRGRHGVRLDRPRNAPRRRNTARRLPAGTNFFS